MKLFLHPSSTSTPDAYNSAVTTSSTSAPISILWCHSKKNTSEKRMRFASTMTEQAEKQHAKQAKVKQYATPLSY